MWRAARRRTRAPADEHRIGSRQTRQTAADPRLGARSSAVEHLTFNQVVVGSIPTGLTNKIKYLAVKWIRLFFPSYQIATNFGGVWPAVAPICGSGSPPRDWTLPSTCSRPSCSQ